MPKAPKALKTWYAASALFFPAVGTFYLAGNLPFVNTGILAAQFTNFGRPATFGLLIATLLTVTALYLAYALIRRRQTTMNGAADHGSDGILVIDETGFVLDTNPAAKKMLGAGARAHGKQTLVDRRIGSLIPDATAHMSDAPAAGVRRGFYLDIQA